MKRYSLKVEKRTELGKAVKKLRREGVIPANIYGKDIKSQAVQVTLKDFMQVYVEAGETGLVDVKLGKDTIPVLIHNVHTNYKENVLHADLFKVNLKEKVKTMVPLEFTGESKAVVDKIGLLMYIVSEVEVEAFPTDLPENISVDVAHLANIDEQITVGDLKRPEGVEILSDAAQVVAKIGELISKEAQEQAAEEAAAAEEAKAEGALAFFGHKYGAESAETVEGEAVEPKEGEETPSEGEQKGSAEPVTEEKAPEEKQEG